MKKKWFYNLVIIGIIVLLGYSIFSYVKTGVNKEGLTFCDDSGCYLATGDMHGRLDMTVCGERITLPPNIGSKDKEVHTHMKQNEIHFEYRLPIDPDTKEVTDKTPLKLNTFLDLVSIELNETCIEGKCNGDLCDGKPAVLSMTVNGVENTLFQNYEWDRDDEIVIKFE